MLRAFLDDYTVYRRTPGVEPVWLAVVRGTTALAVLAAILAFGALNIIINPMQQFQHPLPRRPVPVPVPYQAGFPDVLWGMMWFKKLTFETIPTEPYSKNPFEAYSNKVGNLTVRFHVEALTDDKEFSCSQGSWWKWDRTGKEVDLGMQWSCYYLRPSVGNSSQGSHIAYPVVRLSWTGTQDVDHTLTGYVTSVPIWNTSLPSMKSFGQSLLWNVPVGANMSLGVGKSVIYARPGTFLEAVGFKQKSLEVVGYPPVSGTVPSIEPSSQTTIEMIPEFDAFYGHNADAWEEYIEQTMIEGLAATGGLYTSFDIVFTLIFGRSLVSILFGGRPISPFGAIAIAGHKSLRKKLLRRYPGLAADDSPERGRAVCDFLCDFVVDMGPVQPVRSGQGDVTDTALEFQPHTQLAQRDDVYGTAKPNNPALLEEESKENSVAADPPSPA
ncbi:hypothetical protein M407DRAFT_25924 [Tulasnella calospora MUT 4182]|uniref:Uncharacterized protein n=1 Tax=Tulasnella calospora MUT 4182 TaxID=1051891 RepID=A0A0C3Q622_9AGAM|nr:hypothetical protein M407DRAFT_25924 [Tulasnella calospora MUT 4182]